MMSSTNDDEVSREVVQPEEVEGTNDTNYNTTTSDDPPQQSEEGTGLSQTLPLDWTRLGVSTGENDDNGENEQRPPITIRYPHDVVDLTNEDEDEVELCIVGTAGQKITHIGNDFSRTINTKLESLILRSHIILKIEGLQYFTHLSLLELYDNQIDTLDGLDTGVDGCPGSTLHTLDMSYNSIRDMSPIACCPNLTELYLANNKLRDMAGLKGLTQLKKLDLGANRIRAMDIEQLSGLINLEELWLGKNKIEQIQGLENLTKLRRLDIQSNRLTKIENLTSQCTTLEELFLSHNAITVEGASIPSGLGQKFQQLSIIDLCRNRLITCHPFAHLHTLEELWVSGNKIATYKDVEPLQQIKGLETIYLEYNPIQEDPLYRKKLAELLPSLKQIDANMIGYVPYVSTTTTTTKQSRIVETEEQRIRRLQDMVIARAQQETYGDGTVTTQESSKDETPKE